MRLITLDDIIDICSKIKQRGWIYFFTKFAFTHLSKTKRTFNQSTINHSNWWIIPKVRKRWNYLITGTEELTYEEYIMRDFFGAKKDLRLLSLGSGICSHELKLAEYSNFKEIICIDIAEKRLKEAKRIARERYLNNIHFVCSDILSYPFKKEYFDIVLFHSSLHHFDHIEQFLSISIKNCLKNFGQVIINEYVGATRMQYSKTQIQEVNNALALIPKQYRKRFKTLQLKNRFYGSGIIRMKLADPSECVDSKSILPSLHTHFTTIVEKPYGGNILMNVLKDISHHFIELNTTKEKILNNLFLFEDNYLKSNSSDFVFGIYEKRDL